MLGALCLPALTFAKSCTMTTVNNLIGTSCSIGDVNYDFLSSGTFAPSFTGISAGDITFTPNGSDPLAPSFTLTGPFTETANGSNSGSASQNFVFFWNLSVTNQPYQIVSATSTTFDASLPNSPNFGVIVQGNNLGFTNSILQTGGPNTNPSTASIDLSLFPGSPDQILVSWRICCTWKRSHDFGWVYGTPVSACHHS